MAFATARSLALRGRRRPRDRRAGRRLARAGRPHAGRSGRQEPAREARDRVRMAINNDCGRWPATKRVTILLSPADLPKGGTHYDLAIAVAVMAADKQHEELGPDLLDGWAFIGELSVSGGLRPVPGVLPMVIAASAHGIARVFVPEPQAAEAALVPGHDRLRGPVAGPGVRRAPRGRGARGTRRWSARRRGPSRPGAGRTGSTTSTCADLDGLEDVRYAVEVAAAGGHPLMLIGPRGTGKTSIAERIPTILPDLTIEQSLEVTALHSRRRRPFRRAAALLRPPAVVRPAPHRERRERARRRHRPGTPGPGQPGPPRRALPRRVPALPLATSSRRCAQPLESGEVTIARGEESATYPRVPSSCSPPTRARAATSTAAPAVAASAAWQRTPLPTQADRTDRRPRRHLDGGATAGARPTVRGPAAGVLRRRPRARHRGPPAPGRPLPPTAAGCSTPPAPGPSCTEHWPLLPEGQDLIDARCPPARSPAAG